MEGPSLFLAAEQLNPFTNKNILEVSGNTTIGKERLIGKKILSIFSYGKYLFFQFDTFALRVHFLLFGSFEANIKNIKVTGDYPTKDRPPRLQLKLKNGVITMFSCSIHYIEGVNVKETCDYTIDTMSKTFDENKALDKVLKYPDKEICDVLLDQNIFLGVGNIIKNECLLEHKISPLRTIKSLSANKLKKLIKFVTIYVIKFYEWRKIFELRKHYQIYRQKKCKKCSASVTKVKTGLLKRVSFICPHCQS